MAGILRAASQGSRSNSGPRDVIQNLVRRARLAAGRGHEFFHVVGIEVAHAPVADLAGFAQRLEGRDRLRERHRAAPVQQIQIEPIRVQTFEAAFARRNHAAPARVMRIHLADKEHLVTQSCKRFAEQRLGCAVAVHFGGIDQRHAELDAASQRVDLSRAARRLLAHLPCALPEFRDALAVGQAHACDVARHAGS